MKYQPIREGNVSNGHHQFPDEYYIYCWNCWK